MSIRWVSIKDDLPPIMQRILVCTSRFVGEGYYNPIDNRTEYEKELDNSLGQLSRIEWFGCGTPLFGVTHWAPMPSPPNKE